MLTAEMTFVSPLISSAGFFRKVTLHEFGHLFGVDDSFPRPNDEAELIVWQSIHAGHVHGPAFGLNGTSLMNQYSGPNDRDGNIAPFITPCDRKRANEASSRVS